MKICACGAGASAPLGASLQPGGVNFSVYSKHATRIDLLLFDHRNASAPANVVRLDPARNRSYHYWHTQIAGIGPGQIYAYRAHGPFAPDRGLRFDPDKILLDPYGLAVAVPGHVRPRGRQARRRQRRLRDEERRRRSRPLRLGRRPAALPAVRGDRDLRSARSRLHAPSELRRVAGPARHVRRRHREDSRTSLIWASPRSSSCRCSSSTRRTRRRGG